MWLNFNVDPMKLLTDRETDRQTDRQTRVKQNFLGDGSRVSKLFF